MRGENLTTEEERRLRKKRCLEDLQSKLALLKNDVDSWPRDTRGIGYSDKVYRIQQALEEYRNACDDYAAHLLDR